MHDDWIFEDGLVFFAFLCRAFRAREWGRAVAPLLGVHQRLRGHERRWRGWGGGGGSGTQREKR